MGSRVIHQDDDTGGFLDIVGQFFAQEDMEDDPFRWECSCGRLVVRVVVDMDEDTVALEVVGPGWLHLGQALRCRECDGKYRFAPTIRLVNEH